jgi:hypothetical protein
LAEGIPDIGVFVLVEGIEVIADRAGEQLRLCPSAAIIARKQVY